MMGKLAAGPEIRNEGTSVTDARTILQIGDAQKSVGGGKKNVMSKKTKKLERKYMQKFVMMRKKKAEPV